MHVYVCVIVWHKGSLTASNSLSSGSCCRAEAWWPIPPAPYFSFNDAQINSSTLFQNSFSPLIPRPLSILTFTPPFHPDTRPSTSHNFLSLASIYSPAVRLSFHVLYQHGSLLKHSAYLDSLSYFFSEKGMRGNGNFITCDLKLTSYTLHLLLHRFFHWLIFLCCIPNFSPKSPHLCSCLSLLYLS